VSYCVQWFRANKCPADLLTECEASKRHANGELYTAVIGDLTRPNCFLEFSAFRSVGVEFLDSALRIYRDYSFQEKKPNRLFLSMARVPRFPSDTGEPSQATVFYFDTNGHLTIVRYAANPTGVGSHIVGREERTVDVTNNWEPFPEFGHYEGLARFDRGIPWIEET
jgi:hypothetical protein